MIPCVQVCVRVCEHTWPRWPRSTSAEPETPAKEQGDIFPLSCAQSSPKSPGLPCWGSPRQGRGGEGSLQSCLAESTSHLTGCQCPFSQPFPLLPCEERMLDPAQLRTAIIDLTSTHQLTPRAAGPGFSNHSHSERWLEVPFY